MSISVDSKRCTKCGEVKPLSEFCKLSRAKDGRQNPCKECKREYSRMHRASNPEKYKDYYADNSVKILERQRGYYADNPEKFKERARQYRINNPEKVKEGQRRYYINNLEKVREASRKYRINNPEKVNRNKRKWAANNPEKKRESCRKWDANNPEKKRAYYNNNMEEIKAMTRKRGRSNSANITDLYIRKLLAGSVKNVKNPSHELIELKRQQIIAVRLIKQAKERVRNESDNANV